MAKKQEKKPIPSAVVMVIISAVAAALLWKGLPDQPDSSQEQSSSPFDDKEIPENYIPIYKEAEQAYGVSWEVLAAVHRVETIFSTMDELESPAGAIGHTQFMPCSFVGWSYDGCGGKGDANISEEDLTDTDVIEANGGYGVDADGSGEADPYNIEDAVFSTANYLAANGGADGELRKALHQYNQADWYVEEVLSYAEKYEKHHNAVKTTAE
ncbi:lytic transglycosylase domain-containing protein [Salibacterium aidingense]|uniref:lytic transglycosylase domain-containing protein n=1 Tax=Salibacterium aidingense TaxID=384933 RepID=UPI000405508E|nr:lytic transglycosylase domain-containing protein [Salibacterium aidingense]